jgi:hypothetical protein
MRDCTVAYNIQSRKNETKINKITVFFAVAKVVAAWERRAAGRETRISFGPRWNGCATQLRDWGPSCGRSGVEGDGILVRTR